MKKVKRILKRWLTILGIVIALVLMNLDGKKGENQFIDYCPSKILKSYQRIFKINEKRVMGSF